MKSVKIIRAAFSAAGNVMLMDKAKNAYFCPKVLVTEQKWTKAEDIQLPLYVNVNKFTYNVLDADGEATVNADGTNVTFTRTDVIDVFASAQALADDYADDMSLEILKNLACKTSAKTAGLSESDLNRILEASIY